MNLFKTAALAVLVSTAAFGAIPQSVEGFDQVVFHHGTNPPGRVPRDFRGPVVGYRTAGWWAPGQMKENYVSWKTAVVPAKAATTFSFIGSSSILPSEFSRGPLARLSVNGRPAVTFTIGATRDFTWTEGEFTLKYISKRVEYPYFGSHRQLDLNGDSGFYQLTVPEAAVEAGQPVVLKVELLPFAGWNGGWFMVKERRDTLQQTMATLEGEIEALRRDMSAMNENTHILATRAYSQLLGGDRFQHQVIYENGFRHVHPADLIKLQNGELLLMTREADEHYAADGDVVMVRSKDGGKTWGDRQVIGAVPGLDEREGCGIQLKDGTIMMGVFYNGLYNPDGSYGLKQREPGKRYLGSYIITSKDNGRTWSQPNHVDTTGMPFTGVEGPTDAPIEMPDGSILMAIIGYRMNGDPDNIASVMLRSNDQGTTWTYISTISNGSDGKLGGMVEPGIVRTKTGRIVAGLRTRKAEGAIFMTYSDDDGKTWVPVRQTAMHGHPVDLIELTDGRLMATYGIRTPIHGQPGGIRAAFSSDNGETWDILTEVQIRNDFINWDIGYPESLQNPDGSIFTVYYYNLFGRYFIGGTTWKL